jgi:hypothetical protein
MNYLTNYYKNLSEQLKAKVQYLEKILNEESAPKKGISLEIIDKIDGSALSSSGEGATFIAVGEDNKPYTFSSDAQWAYARESNMGRRRTTHVHSGNPNHGIVNLTEIKPDSGNEEHAKLFDYYKNDFDYNPPKKTK